MSSTTNSATAASFGSAPSITPEGDQAASGNIVYEPVKPGETVFDTDYPYLVSADGAIYKLPYPHIFDYGTPNSIILDNFADNDHQNNLGAALATYRGENYTEGGGYWYTFADKNGTSLKNANNLSINAYNIGKAISGNELHLKMTVANPGFAGVGANLLFEAAGVDLSDLDYVEVTAYGSGTIGVMFETTDINKPTEWGNYATKTPMTLSNTPTKFKYLVSDFEGEKHSGLEGMPLQPHLNVASKFFFQAKDGATVDIHIEKIEFFFNKSTTPLRLAAFKWKTGEIEPNPGFEFDFSQIGVPPTLNPNDPYINWSTATIAPVKTQTAATVKTSQQLANTGKPNWLRVEGTKLYDSHNHLVRMTGVNWFGFETKNMIPFGLNARSYKDMLAQIKTVGFNTVRIPYSDYVLDESRAGTLLLKDLDINLTLNAMNGTQTPLDLLDAIIAESGKLGLKVILDSHSRKPDSYLIEGIWNLDYPESKWIDNWKFIAARYADNDAVAAFDLKNEPHFEAAWAGPTSSLNWNEAAIRCANAIQTVNNNALIIVEGVESLNATSTALNKYWWGGNLQGVINNPITITFQNKLVYSPHEYGPEVYLQPWFRDYRFPQNLPFIWEDRFGFIYSKNIGHTLVGEFGIKEDIMGSAANKWFDDFIQYMGDRSEGYSWTYWAWNPNSGDTGGILTDDWNTVHTWKVDKLKPYMAPLIGNKNGL
jgi:aryl-phospho-beta-D-glucosidase BglC (GH1 family)